MKWVNILKIAMIGHKRIPSREGGVEIVVEELSTRMVKKGLQVDVYNRSGRHVATNEKSKKIRSYKGVKIITVPTSNLKSLNALIYSGLATLRAVFGRYDVIHYHAEGPAAMLIIPHILGIRTIVTIHGLDWQRAKWGGFATKYLKFGEKMAAKYADEIIVLSTNVQRYFKEKYGRETNYIPNGVKQPKLMESSLIKKKYDLNKNGYFLFLARIVPEKGLHYLLEAYRKLDTEIKLVIAGGISHSGEYAEEIKKMAKKDKRVKMVGFVQGDELGELFSNCLAYVLPSDIEGMPISLLEAMSYKRKCIVSDIPENMEVVENQALHFKKGDVQDLNLKLQEVLNGINEKTDSGYKEYDMRRFDWDRVTEDNLKVYKSKARG